MQLLAAYKMLPPQLMEFFRFSAIAGLIAAVTLLINLHYSAFRYIFKERTKTYWWLFIVMTVIPLFLFLYVFSLLFEAK